MQLITTTDQLKAYNESVYENTIGYVAIQRKDNIDKFHPGHEACVEILKQHADKVLVSFFDTASLFNNLYPEYSFVFQRKGDMDACLEWCDNHSVDLVFWPDFGVDLSWIESYNLDDLKNWVDNVVSENNYCTQDKLAEILLKTTIIYERIRIDLGLDRRDVRVGSSKDGSWRLSIRHFFKEYTGKEYLIIDPVIDPYTGFPYTELDRDLISSQKEYLLQLPDLIDSDKDQIKINLEQYKQNLISTINSLDSTGTFYVYEVNVFHDEIVNWLDQGKALIEIHLHVNDKFRRVYKEGYMVYSRYI